MGSPGVASSRVGWFCRDHQKCEEAAITRLPTVTDMRNHVDHLAHSVLEIPDLARRGEAGAGRYSLPFCAPSVKLRLSRSRVSRGLHRLSKDAFGVLTLVTDQAQFAIARCPNCARRHRVVPCDVLPGKQYSLPVIESLSAAYATGERSLREVAEGIHGDRILAHSTLHAWTEGMGAFALGRAGGGLPGVDPIGRILSETQTRQPELGCWIDLTLPIDSRRFRSEGRRERLSAVSSLLAVSKRATETVAPGALTEWRRRMLTWTGRDSLQFPSGLLYTPIEHVTSDTGASWEATRDSGVAPRCPPLARSPPGASK